MGLRIQFQFVKFTLAVLFFITLGIVPALSEQDKRVWNVQGKGVNVSVADCNNCDEDIGLILSCTSLGKSAELTVPWAAVEKGVKDAPIKVEFIIDGKSQVFDGVSELQEIMGYLPKLIISPTDPLIDALGKGERLIVKFSGDTTEISLKGSGPSFAKFKAECGTASSY